MKWLLCFRELFGSKKCYLVGGGGRLVHDSVGGGEEEGHAGGGGGGGLAPGVLQPGQLPGHS